MKIETQIHRAQYRIPKPMADWLKARAAAHFRSMNAELLVIIREAMARHTFENGNAPTTGIAEARKAETPIKRISR